MKPNVTLFTGRFVRVFIFFIYIFCSIFINMNPFRYRGNRRRPGAHGEMPVNWIILFLLLFHKNLPLTIFQLVCRMCSPLRFFTFYEHLRAHLRSVHAIRDLSREQISLYESYPGSRNEMRHFVSNTRQGGARQASQNDNVLPSMISNAVSVGKC